MRYEYRSILVRAAVLAAAAATSTSALADADLDSKMADSSNWAAQAGDYANHRYSELKQINASNVGKLQVAWTMSTGRAARPRGIAAGHRRHDVSSTRRFRTTCTPST